MTSAVDVLSGATGWLEGILDSGAEVVEEAMDQAAEAAQTAGQAAAEAAIAATDAREVEPEGLRMLDLNLGLGGGDVSLTPQAANLLMFAGAALVAMWVFK